MTPSGLVQSLRAKLRGLDSWNKIIRFDKYPVHDIEGSAARTLIAAGRENMVKLGAYEMPDFVTPAAIEALQLESAILERAAFFKPVVGNPYLTPEDPSLPKDHPNRMTETTRVGVVAYDQYPRDSLLRRIYEWDPLMNFVGKVLNLPEIHRYADPMGGLNLAVMTKDDYLRWHFDQADFVTSLSVQSSDDGGKFEYAPLIRTTTEERYDDVRNLLQGNRDKVTTITNSPGTLVLFQGRWSIHRVTPIAGDRNRLMGLFGFDSKPGVMSSSHLYDIRYGRTAILKEPPTFEDYDRGSKK